MRIIDVVPSGPRPGHLRLILARLASGLHADARVVAVAPLLGLLSALTTLAVAVGTLTAGHLPGAGAAGLVCALVLAAVAGGAAVAPAKSVDADRSGEDAGR